MRFLDENILDNPDVLAPLKMVRCILDAEAGEMYPFPIEIAIGSHWFPSAEICFCSFLNGCV